jgi:NitT/TauT family transport system permease protein
VNSLFRRRFASVALILGFFLAWELLCLAFGVKAIVLPRPSQIVVTLGQRMPAIWPHALQTLYTTLVGFALGIIAGVLLGAFVGSSKLATTWRIRCSSVLEHSEGRGGSDLRSLVRRRHHSRRC